MKLFKLNGMLALVIALTSCGGGGGGVGYNAGDLTGIWRLELNNTLYLLIQNQSTVTVKVCNSDGPYTVSRSSNGLYLSGTKLFTINSTTQLEISSGVLAGTKLNKVSDNSQFASGSVAIQSSNIADLSATSDVCAYRESDGVHNVVASPYSDGYLEMTIAVDGMAAGYLTIPTDVSLSIESNQLPGASINASAGTVTVTEYTGTRFAADYSFIAIDGNAYTGSVDVDL